MTETDETARHADAGDFARRSLKGALHLPPIFTPWALEGADAFAQVCEQVGDCDAAELFWCPADTLLDCAVVLEPEQLPAVALQALHIGAVALADCLAVAAPPSTAVHLNWPAEAFVNDGLAAKVRLAVTRGPADAPPQRMVLGFLIDLGEPGGGGDGGLAYEETTLRQEGYDVTPERLLESLSRHLLFWISRWQDEGLPPIAKSWHERAKETRLDLLGAREQDRMELSEVVDWLPGLDEDPQDDPLLNTAPPGGRA